MLSSSFKVASGPLKSIPLAIYCKLRKRALVPILSPHRYASSWLPRKELRTIPNMITTTRILASPGLALAICYDMKVTALVGCLVFGFSDWLDGYLAKKLKQQTTLGAFLDPVADKIMIGALTVGLVAQGYLPYQLAALYVGRDVALIAASFALRVIEQPRDSAFFDTLDSATFTLTPSDISKLNTVLQFALLGGTLSQFAFGFPSTEYLEPLWWITGVTTVWSGAGYLDGSGVGRFKAKKNTTNHSDKAKTGKI